MMKSSKDYISSCAALPDHELSIGRTLLAFAALDHPDRHLDRYQNQLQTHAKTAKDQHETLLKAGADDNAGSRIAALHHALVLSQGYFSAPIDPQTTQGNALQQRQLIGILDHKAAHPAFLAALYYDCADQVGWDIAPLSLPQIYVLKADCVHQGIIFDPAQNNRTLQSHDIRAMLKDALGDQAELSNEFFKSQGKRDTIIAALNSLKSYYISEEDYPKALELVQAMQSFAPDEYRLLLDSGVLYARTQQVQSALFALNRYVDQTPDARSRAEALILIEDLKQSH